MNYRDELIKCANATGGYAGESASDDFLACVVDEVTLLRDKCERLEKKLNFIRKELDIENK